MWMIHYIEVQKTKTAISKYGPNFIHTKKMSIIILVVQIELTKVILKSVISE